MKRTRWALIIPSSLALLAFAQPSQAQQRNDSWDTATKITMAAAAGTELLMPRVFYSDPEVTVGWKARWHVSVLAPLMTLAVLGGVNEYALKDSFEGYRPGCDDDNRDAEGCESYGMVSTETYGSFAALGHGAAVFLFDTTKWSDGKFNAGSLVGHVAVPFVLSGVTAIGRSEGGFESGEQIIAGGAAGLATGFLMGMTYALMQQPSCGYGGSMICW